MAGRLRSTLKSATIPLWLDTDMIPNVVKHVLVELGELTFTPASPSIPSRMGAARGRGTEPLC
jgi:hypothetical protein